MGGASLSAWPQSARSVRRPSHKTAGGALCLSARLTPPSLYLSIPYSSQKKRPQPPAPPAEERTLVDVVAGALARALSQSAIHPLDTLKVRG